MIHEPVRGDELVEEPPCNMQGSNAMSQLESSLKRKTLNFIVEDLIGQV